MATLLANRRMNPALVARIEASIRHGRTGSAAAAPRVVAMVRLAMLLAIVSALVSLLLARHRAGDELAHARAALLASVRAESAQLSNDDRGTVSRAEVWLTRLAGPYEGDRVAAELREPGELTRLLSRPSVYVRGLVDAFKAPAAIAQTASTSPKDAFLLCLLDPPPARDEKTVLAKVRIAYAGGAPMEERSASVAPLHAGEVGLPFLEPGWAQRVTTAETRHDLAHLEREFARAPIAEAKRVARARLLLAVMDEPGTSTGLSELDGERPHDVRVGIVDLAAAKVLLRLRKRVDPGWISLQRRPNYASGLDSCALAMDVRDSLLQK